MTAMAVNAVAGQPQPNALRRLLLYILVISIVILPIRFHTIQYIVLATFLLICLDVGLLALSRLRVPYSPAYLSIAVLTFIYAFWALLSVYYNNNLVYLFKDSAGFLVYLTFPVLYVYVVSNRLSATLGRALLVAAGLVVFIHLTVFATFYALFDTLTFANLTAANAGLSAAGFNWELGASSGVLRANTKAGHYILMGIALLYCRFAMTKQPIYLLLMGVFFVGALLDGHRALLVAILLFAVLVAPLAIRDLEQHPLKFVVPIGITVAVLVVTFALFIDAAAMWDRFSAFETLNFRVRFGQIDSLVARIDERPLLGNGFGSFTDVIRSDERPFMYEVDFLAVVMKLGVIGATAYFIVYIATISLSLVKRPTTYNFTIFSLGMAYLFYMGTNGGFAMSPISSFFHVLLFLCVTVIVIRPEGSPRKALRKTVAASRNG